MCPCLRPHVCGYHEQVIRDLADRLRQAEDAGDDSARSLRGELASYGWKTETILAEMAGEEQRDAAAAEAARLREEAARLVAEAGRLEGQR